MCGEAITKLTKKPRVWHFVAPPEGGVDRGIALTRVTAPILIGFAPGLRVLAARIDDEHDLHRRLQEARLLAEPSCGQPTILASDPPDLGSLELSCPRIWSRSFVIEVSRNLGQAAWTMIPTL